MSVRMMVVGLAALAMTSTALALSCAFPAEVAEVALDSAVFGEETTQDDLGIVSVQALYQDHVILVLDTPDGSTLSFGLDRVDGGE